MYLQANVKILHSIYFFIWELTRYARRYEKGKTLISYLSQYFLKDVTK